AGQLEVTNRGARSARFGENLDVPSGRLCAVQRGGRGALDDLDVVDVARVDVLQRVGGVLSAPARAMLLVRNPHAVDIDERLNRLRDGVDPANLDRAARTR